MHSCFQVSTQNFSLLLNCIEHSKSASEVFSGVDTEFLGELSSQNIYQNIIDVSCTQVPIAMVTHNLHLSLDKRSNTDGKLAMTKINEYYISGILWWQVALSEETISKTHSSALIDESCAFKIGNIACIENSLSLDVREIGGHRDDDISGQNACNFVEILELLQKEAEHLLRSEYVFLSSDSDLETDLFVFEWHDLVCHKLLLFLELLYAISVKS